MNAIRMIVRKNELQTCGCGHLVLNLNRLQINIQFHIGKKKLPLFSNDLTKATKLYSYNR